MPEPTRDDVTKAALLLFDPDLSARLWEAAWIGSAIVQTLRQWIDTKAVPLHAEYEAASEALFAYSTDAADGGSTLDQAKEAASEDFADRTGASFLAAVIDLADDLRYLHGVLPSAMRAEREQRERDLAEPPEPAPPLSVWQRIRAWCRRGEGRSDG